MKPAGLTQCKDDSSGSGVTRREFMALAASGLFVFWMPEELAAFQEPTRLPARPSYPTDVNSYLHIGADGRVTCFAGKVELGQGAKTVLAQLAAEELDVPIDSVDMVLGDTALCPWDMGTFGSLNVRQFGPVLRSAAAKARAELLQMASDRLQTPVTQLHVHDGVISDAAQGKRVSYGELVKGQRIELHVKAAEVKPVSSMRLVGHSPQRKDALEKVSGKAKYAADFAFPGMLQARVLRPPAHGASLKEVDTKAAEKLSGVQVVRDGDLIAVLHPTWDGADAALRAIKAQWENPGPGTDDRSIFEHLLKHAPAPQTVAESGSLAEGEKQAATVLERTYLNSYVAHAPIEPHSATALVDGGKITVWAGTQTPFAVRQQVAQALNVQPDAVRVITPYVGGGFGGKSASRQALEAARLAKIVGRSVQVVWDRTEELFYDTFRPAAVVKMRSGLTSAGKICFWDHQVYGAGDREAQPCYDIANQRTLSSGGWGGGNPEGMHPFAVGPWRAPSANTNVFARESHIDTLASMAKVDPLEFRLAHLSDPRMRRVLEAAARQFGWKPARTPSGRGVGVACAVYSGTYVAAMSEVVVDKKTGHVQVKRVVLAQDQGLIVHPEGTRQQIEGCITMGLGYALTEEVQFKDGRVLNRNFDTYQLPRFSWLPKIEAVLIENAETPATGCGEPPIIVIGAVVANAIYDAAGVRLLQLPMSATRVKQALAKV